MVADSEICALSAQSGTCANNLSVIPVVTSSTSYYRVVGEQPGHATVDNKSSRASGSLAMSVPRRRSLNCNWTGLAQAQRGVSAPARVAAMAVVYPPTAWIRARSKCSNSSALARPATSAPAVGFVPLRLPQRVAISSRPSGQAGAGWYRRRRDFAAGRYLQYEHARYPWFARACR